MSHTSYVSSTVDVECYVDYFLVRFSTGEVFQMFDGCALDTDGLRKALSIYTIITFNGIAYDLPIIALALAGADNARLKQASDDMIVREVPHWEVLKSLSVKPLDWVDHIDLINVAPGVGSLKAYGAKMHVKKLQELPIEPSTSIAWPDRVLLRAYCGNDLIVTDALFNKFVSQLKLRSDMSAEYGIDLRSKSDAQIAEAVMRSIVGNIKPPYIPPGSTFCYRAPDWIKFVNLDLVKFVESLPFTITESGGIEMHETLAKTYITIGQTRYKLGAGGLHSTESSITHRASETHVLRDHDVAGYYPHLVVRLGIYPEQIGSQFQTIYGGWRTRRLAAKHAGDKKTANSLKTLNNGTFGKLGSKYSIFYAPRELIQVTLTGQLALLMLIEQFELAGISVISANTDGVVLHCPRALEWFADEILKHWENLTQFETERTDYSLLCQRDVNSYIAVTLGGDVKLKGAFAPAEPGASGWPNPTGQICVDAIVAYLTNGIPLLETIQACRDIRQFIYVRAVRGGGVLCIDPLLSSNVSKRFKIEHSGSVEAYDAATCIKPRVQYLGKIVRWYYGAGSEATIRYKSSMNLVPRSVGCVPVMDLPDEFSDDVDYDWYVKECESMLVDIGVNYVC